MVAGVVKWHWDREAWQRQTSVRRRLTPPLPPPEGIIALAAGEDANDEGERETDDGTPESMPPGKSAVSTDGDMNSTLPSSLLSSSSFSSIDRRVKGMSANFSASSLPGAMVGKDDDDDR